MVFFCEEDVFDNFEIFMIAPLIGAALATGQEILTRMLADKEQDVLSFKVYRFVTSFL